MDNKTININGINNRYQMKKLINENREKKTKIYFNNHYIDENILNHENQLYLLNKLKDKEHNLSISKINLTNEPNDYHENQNLKIIINEIEKKINSYKQQDIQKKLFCNDKFINFKNIIDKLIEYDLKCFYCKCEMYIIYKIVRETKQWSVDRIDNDIGHNTDNYVISCLECNLKKRRKNHEKFLFTKQLNINKLDK